MILLAGRCELAERRRDLSHIHAVSSVVAVVEAVVAGRVRLDELFAFTYWTTVTREIQRENLWNKQDCDNDGDGDVLSNGHLRLLWDCIKGTNSNGRPGETLWLN